MPLSATGNWLGTDDQGRDVLARLIYGFRISVLFGLILTILSSIIGVAAGAVQGYFGGWVDLCSSASSRSGPRSRRSICCSSCPRSSAELLVLLGILLLFSWTSLVGVVRAEFLRGAQFRICAGGARARRHRQLSDHVAPPAAQRDGGDAHLHALHSLGLGDDADRARLSRLRPAAGLASLGELLRRARQPAGAVAGDHRLLHVIAIMLSLLVFIGEAVRDAFDPRKTFA
jgi:microcin C transport system permease protein